MWQMLLNSRLTYHLIHLIVLRSPSFEENVIWLAIREQRNWYWAKSKSLTCYHQVDSHATLKKQTEIPLEKSFQLNRKAFSICALQQYALPSVLQILHLSLRPTFQDIFIISPQMILSQFRRRSFVIKRFKYLCLRSLSVRVFDDFDLISNFNHRKLEL